jgi:hypothetical protein
MFRAELELFAESCRSGQNNELNAENGIVAVSAVYAALRSIELNGQSVKLAEVVDAARRRQAEWNRNVA